MGERLSDADQTRAEEAFVRYLRAHREKFTKPRQAILRSVLEMDEHFEAERLLAHLRQAGHRVAKATLYRTLPLLVRCGILKEIQFGTPQAHFELIFGLDPHDHMVCRRCGRIIEFRNEQVQALRQTLAEAHEFYALAHRFQISGLCGDCVKRCPAGVSA